MYLVYCVVSNRHKPEQMHTVLLTNKLITDTGGINKNCAKMLKSRPELFQQIVQATNFLPNIATITERLFCIIHNITTQPICLYCNNPTKYLTNKKMYQPYCSAQCASLCPISKRGRRQTNNIKFGGNAPLCDTSIIAKVTATNRKKYGVDWHQQSDYGQSVRSDTLFKKYGVANTLSTLGRAGFAKKYGVRAPILVPQIKQQILQTVSLKYKRSHHSQIHLSTDALDKLNNKQWLSEQHHANKITLTEIAEQLGCDTSTVMNYFTLHQLHNTRFAQSSYERRIVESLKLLGVQNIHINTKQVIFPLELDIFIPDKNLAIEVCGLYWHADIHPRITPNYHRTKYLACKDKNIRLLTIFEDELVHNFQLVIDKISYILGLSDQPSTYGRKCALFVPNSEQKILFMNQHHIQGYDRSTKTIGLMHHNVPVAMMSLKKKQNDIWEITRYCSVGKVVGGFSKLLKYARTTLLITKFETFADLRWGNGNLYSLTGFKEDYTIPPTFYYVQGTYRKHRSNYMKCKLHKILPNFDPLLTEFQNCDNANLLRIWDCGKTKYSISY